jgi:hypothetical protein
MEKSDANICELELMSKLYKVRRMIYKTQIEKSQHEIKQEYMATLSHDDVKLINKEKIDMFEVDHREKTVTIWEGKKCDPTVDDLRQLSFYYRNILYFSEFKTYTIICKFVVVICASKPNQAYVDELSMIRSAYPHFTPSIERFEDYNIGPN